MLFMFVGLDVERWYERQDNVDDGYIFYDC